LLNDQWDIAEIRDEIKKFLGDNEKSNHNLWETMRHSKGSPKKKVYHYEWIY
jgi:hypothetical protein